VIYGRVREGVGRIIGPDEHSQEGSLLLYLILYYRTSCISMVWTKELFKPHVSSRGRK
jgi:hypothetical protein